MIQSGKAFCTIITNSYIPYAKVLRDSISKFDSDITLHVLVVDTDYFDEEAEIDGISFYSKESIDHELVSSLSQKYLEKELFDEYRWSMKSVFIQYLISKGLQKVIFIDPDLYFFNDFSFLFDELEENKFLLSPHWRSKNPNVDPTNFHLIFQDGVFNGGFIGARFDAIEILQWWASVCFYACEKNYEKGLYVDQKYLDAVPAYFDGVKILRHHGCNVAAWNRKENPRSRFMGKTLVSKKFPVIFIHFTKSTLRQIRERDKTLQSHLKTYESNCRKYGIEI